MSLNITGCVKSCIQGCVETAKNIGRVGKSTKNVGIIKGGVNITGNRIKPKGFLSVPHRLGIYAVNFYAEMPSRTEKEEVGLPHPIVDKNHGQIHQAPGWGCSHFRVYIF